MTTGLIELFEREPQRVAVVHGHGDQDGREEGSTPAREHGDTMSDETDRTQNSTLAYRPTSRNPTRWYAARAAALKSLT